jgi:hypothetical protein
LRPTIRRSMQNDDDGPVCDVLQRQKSLFVEFAGELQRESHFADPTASSAAAARSRATSAVATGRQAARRGRRRPQCPPPRCFVCRRADSHGRSARRIGQATRCAAQPQLQPIRRPRQLPTIAGAAGSDRHGESACKHPNVLCFGLVSRRP